MTFPSGVTVPAAWLSPPGIVVPAEWITQWPAPPEGVVFLAHATVGITAYMPGLTFGTVVQLDVAQVTVTAYDVGVGSASGVDVPLDHADIAVTTFDVTAVRGTVVALDAATPIVVTAFDVTHTMGAAVPLDLTTLAITAYDVGIAAGAAGAVQLDHATLAITAYDVSVTSETRIALDAADIAVTTFDVSVMAGRAVPLDSADITVGAFDLAVTAARVVALDPVTLAVSALDVAVASGTTVPLDPAALTVTAFDVTPISSAGVALDTANIAVTAYDVTVASGRAIALDPAVVTVTAFDATPAVAKSVALDTATLAIATYDPLLSITTVTDVGATPTITITAFDVTVNAGSAGANVALDAASITVTAFDVTVTAGSGNPWTNHVAIAAPRNSTTTHTVSPSAGTVAAGSLFTPTAGRLLVCVVEGAVTSTTPTGWTLPTNGSAIQNTGLYVWWRSAAGSDSFTTTHNGSNYPVIFHFFEYAAGHTFVKAASSVGVAYAAAGANLTALTGSNHLFGVVAAGLGGSSTTGSVAWSGTPTPTELIDSLVPWTGGGVDTDGYLFSLCYVASSTATAFQPTGNMTAPASAAPNKETLTFAVSA